MSQVCPTKRSSTKECSLRSNCLTFTLTCMSGALLQLSRLYIRASAQTHFQVGRVRIQIVTLHTTARSTRCAATWTGCELERARLNRVYLVQTFRRSCPSLTRKVVTPRCLTTHSRCSCWQVGRYRMQSL